MQHLLGLLLASLITAWMAALYVPRIATLENQRFDNGSATQFLEFTEAGQRFLEQERAVLAADLAADPLSFPRSYQSADLVARNVLSSQFLDPNTFEQRHALLVRPLVLGGRTHLEGLAVTYGGRSMIETEAGRLALLAGPRAGRVHTSDPDRAVGGSGQWAIDISHFAGGSVPLPHQPVPGHLAAYLSTLSAAEPSAPALTAAGVFRDGDAVPKPICTTGIPQIFVLPVQFSDNGDGYPILGLQAYAEEPAGESSWIVRLDLFRENPNSPGNDERLTLDPDHGHAAVFTSCG